MSASSPSTWPSRLLLAGRCVLAGLCIAASLPPWGWWPLAFVGIALLDRLIAGGFGGWRASRLRPADALRRVD